MSVFNFFLFDVPAVDSTSLGVAGLITAMVFFLIFAGGAFIVFQMVKRTVKMAFRLAIVGILLLVAVVGSASIYWFMQGNTAPTKRPTQNRPNR